MKPSYQQLWRKVRKGNLKAFEILYKISFAQLCLYAYSFVHDEGVVKEIINDVFLNIWQKRRDIEIRSGIKPYLYRSVHNACIDYLNKEKRFRQQQVITISDFIKEIPGQDEDFILQQIIAGEVERDIMGSINKLPLQCREIFMLSRFELLTYNEISARLNISVNTVKTQISRALESLRENLTRYLEGGRG